MRPNVIRDVALFIARLALGVVFIAHGWQKFTENGVDGTAAGFEGMGIPLPTVSAWFVSIVELVGGVALLIGLAVPVFGLLLVVDMLGAFLLVHVTNGVFVTEGGFELVAALGVGALLLAVVGAGRFSVDHVVAPRMPEGAARRAFEPVGA